MEIKKLLLVVLILRLALLIKGQLDLPPPPPSPTPTEAAAQPHAPHPSEEPPQQPAPTPQTHPFGAPRLPFPYAFPAPFSNQFAGHPQGFLAGPTNQTGHPGFATPEIGFGPNFGPREPFVPYRNPNYIFPARGPSGAEPAHPSQEAKTPEGTPPVTGTEYHQGFSHTQKTPNAGQNQDGAGFQGYPQFNYEAFRPSFGPIDFDFGHNFAQPQQVSQNIQVDGQHFGNEVIPGGGVELPSGPVAGFYGPPPNIRHYSIPSLGVQGYQYDSRDDGRNQPRPTAPTGKGEASTVKA